LESTSIYALDIDKYPPKWLPHKKFWEEQIAYFPLIRHGPHRKHVQQIFLTSGTSLPSRYLATIGMCTDGGTDSPLLRHGPPRKWRVQQFFYCFWYLLPRERVVPNRCLAMIGGMHIQTHRLMVRIFEVRRWDGHSCHDVHTKFHKDWFTHSKVDRGWYRHTRQAGDHISILYESRLKWRGKGSVFKFEVYLHTYVSSDCFIVLLNYMTLILKCKYNTKNWHRYALNYHAHSFFQLIKYKRINNPNTVYRVQM
jgi:hypothetical protein